MNNYNNNDDYTIVKFYDNAELDKDKILSIENWRTGGIFMWTHKATGNKYIGCSQQLSKHLSSFYIFPFRPKEKVSRIRTDLFFYGHAQFSLTILAYIKKNRKVGETNKSSYQKILIERQRFISLIKPEYNRRPKK